MIYTYILLGALTIGGGSVPDRGCRILLKVVLVRRWEPGFWEFGRGGGDWGRVGKGEVSLQAT